MPRVSSLKLILETYMRAIYQNVFIIRFNYVMKRKVSNDKNILESQYSMKEYG